MSGFIRTERLPVRLLVTPEKRAETRTELSITTKQSGRKTSEKLVTPPEPGYNVVTSLDLHLQELAEKALAAKAKRGAMVIVDPNSGDVLALASWPTYDPNVFVPSISPDRLKALQSDPD